MTSVMVGRSCGRRRRQASNVDRNPLARFLSLFVFFFCPFIGVAGFSPPSAGGGAWSTRSSALRESEPAITPCTTSAGARSP